MCISFLYCSIKPNLLFADSMWEGNSGAFSQENILLLIAVIMYYAQYAVAENIHSFPTERTGISLGLGSFVGAHFLKEDVKLYLNFQRGGVSFLEVLNIEWWYAQFNLHLLIQMYFSPAITSKLLDSLWQFWQVPVFISCYEMSGMQYCSAVLLKIKLHVSLSRFTYMCLPF